MWVEQTILKKDEVTIYLSEQADIDYYKDVLGYAETGKRTVKDGVPVNEQYKKGASR